MEDGTIAGREVVALRKESVDRNRERGQPSSPHSRSLSARRAWIEITSRRTMTAPTRVALRKESVDRNILPSAPARQRCHVALRKESVDRNLASAARFGALPVALRKESVDRNRQPTKSAIISPVALRKESVDRNIQHLFKESIAGSRSPQGERG